MVLQWVNNGEEWDDMGFTLWYKSMVVSIEMGVPQ